MIQIPVQHSAKFERKKKPQRASTAFETNSASLWFINVLFYAFKDEVLNCDFRPESFFNFSHVLNKMEQSPDGSTVCSYISISNQQLFEIGWLLKYPHFSNEKKEENYQ